MTDLVLSYLARARRPVPTPHLVAVVTAADRGNPATLRARVWSALRWLARCGLVRRVRPYGWKTGRPVRWEIVPSTDW